MVSYALSNPRGTFRTRLCMSPTPSIDTRVLKITPRFWHAAATFSIIGMARFGVMPVVLIPNFRRRGSRSSITSQISTRSFLVVGSPPETLAISIFFQKSDSNTRAICSNVMSSLRSPRFQLLHISQRASHTHVQLKISTVGWIGLMVAM